jgi:hypothetical protein
MAQAINHVSARNNALYRGYRNRRYDKRAKRRAVRWLAESLRRRVVLAEFDPDGGFSVGLSQTERKQMMENIGKVSIDSLSKNRQAPLSWSLRGARHYVATRIEIPFRSGGHSAERALTCGKCCESGLK